MSDGLLQHCPGCLCESLATTLTHMECLRPSCRYRRKLDSVPPLGINVTEKITSSDKVGPG